ncbi:MAG: DUF3565 domain-containing protein [Alphaproteobacteria bacterium]|nr:DUF3565 domain-containing protein [Alphaproteobacteria bacterium]
MTGAAGVGRRIIGFARDEEGDWIALLDCGHRQHVRHRPPWTNRPWVASAAGRQAHLGHALHCVDCVEDQADERENQ